MTKRLIKTKKDHAKLREILDEKEAAEAETPEEETP